MFSRRRLVLSVAAFLAGLIAALVWVREPTAPLTESLLAEARQRWEQADIRNYSLRYRMHGSEYVVTVRGESVDSVTVNGQPSTSATPAAFGVPGLFETLAVELENRSDPAGPLAGQSETLLMRARFHPELGYPERYIRSAGGGVRGASIEMLEFRRR